MLPIIHNAEDVTMTSFDFLNNIINPARELFGESPVANDKFLKKVADEIGFTENEKMSFTQQGHFKPTSYFILNFDHMTLVGMRESKGVRKSILNKLKQLAKPQEPRLPQTFAEALQLAADQAKQLELAAPKIAFVDNYVAANGNKTFREVAKILKANERMFRSFMVANKIQYHLNGSWVAYQNHIDAGRFSQHVGEKNGHAYTDCKFTPKGIQWISQLWENK